jgi:hypothetical protein
MICIINMTKLFVVCGMQKGGQHFIVSQILAMFHKTIFKNDCSGHLDVKSYTCVIYNDGNLVENSNIYDVREIPELDTYDAVILGCENTNYNTRSTTKLLTRIEGYFTDVKIIQVYRNPLNTIAAYVKINRTEQNMDMMINITKLVFDWYHEYLSNIDDYPMHYVCFYDYYLSDIDKRTELLNFSEAQNQQEYIESFLNKRDHIGSTSFTGNNNFLKRYTLMIYNERYLDILRNNSWIIDVAKELFNFDDEELLLKL